MAAWNERLESSFHLVVKAHRRITHRSRLAGIAGPLVAFLRSIEPLRALRVVLWQLPPSLQKNLDRLGEFLDELDATEREVLGARRPRLRHAVEFRHESWWYDDVAALLAKHRASFVAVSHPKLPETVLSTADLLYLRFHGKGRRLYDYSRRELKQWVESPRPHLERRRLYAFFNNDRHTNAPKNALAFRELLARS
ncbi:MAG: DUF72 domain-containing protein [Acidobacteriota bacterium]|nr:MAG: DUF72 domain-containing protein [Acidobacteriota bacterium]